ncbi:hypothetical protein HG536_0D05300 [Torulaspora globosa]|uniref:UBC core domain-containing protein n=1 Tax=Torulaspora globosa TaxID=48254 RepID=A0A7G3ZHM2_9SACH|nr:uncharacterized protein HG536_0D05300 [Torulaspora globosa]QLL33008.1 hypothetical protein HG536_0D05300 [Torulaspora globosa]
MRSWQCSQRVCRTSWPCYIRPLVEFLFVSGGKLRRLSRLFKLPLHRQALSEQVRAIMSRVAKEYKKIAELLSQDDGELGTVSLEPREGDLSCWDAVIRGPRETPYAGHRFKLTLTLQEDYPRSPPKVMFEPGAMPHCNVDFQTGEICLDILTRNHWSPAWDLLHVLEAVVQLLGEPVPESPLNIDIANILKAGDSLAYRDLINYYLCLPCSAVDSCADKLDDAVIS